MSEKKEKCAAHCAHCQYPLYAYARCCPMCGSTVKQSALPSANEDVATTRLGFWLAHLRKSFGLRGEASAQSPF